MKNLNKGDKVLLVVGIFLGAFIVTMIVLFCIYQAVPDTLIQYVLGAGGIESVALAAIKIVNVRSENKSGKEDPPGEG